MEAAFMKRSVLQRTPPQVRKTILRMNRPYRERAESAGDLTMDMSTIDDLKIKRKRDPTQSEDNHSASGALVDLVKNLLDGITELSRTVATAANTRRDVVACTSNLDTLAKKLSGGKLQAMVEELESQRAAMTSKMATQKEAAKTVTCEVGTQCPEPGMVWGNPTKPRFTHTKVVEGSPLALGSEWDLAVLRAKTDPKMNLGIQGLFKQRFEGILEQEGDVIHVKTATWIPGSEPVFRSIYRIDDGETEDLRRRTDKVLSEVSGNKRCKLALPWDEQLTGKLEDLRGMLEETAAKHKVEVSIHVKPKGKSKKDDNKTTQTRRANADAILVKKAESATDASTLKMVRDEVVEKSLGNTIRVVRESKSGDLVLTLTRQPAGGKTGRIKQALQTKLDKERVCTPKQKTELST